MPLLDRLLSTDVKKERVCRTSVRSLTPLWICIVQSMIPPLLEHRSNSSLKPGWFWVALSFEGSHSHISNLSHLHYWKENFTETLIFCDSPIKRTKQARAVLQSGHWCCLTHLLLPALWKTGIEGLQVQLLYSLYFTQIFEYPRGFVPLWLNLGNILQAGFCIFPLHDRGNCLLFFSYCIKKLPGIKLHTLFHWQELSLCYFSLQNFYSPNRKKALFSVLKWVQLLKWTSYFLLTKPTFPSDTLYLSWAHCWVAYKWKHKSVTSC